MSCQYLDTGDKVCCTERKTTERTVGVWTTCDECGHDWWCVVGERDWMDEAVTHVCSGGCEDGFPPGYFADDFGDNECPVCQRPTDGGWCGPCIDLERLEDD